MSEKPISPLRRRMIEDMTVRNFVEKTRNDYIRHVRSFTAFLGRSPDTATPEDLRGFQVHQTQTGVHAPSINGSVAALRFFFTVTLDRPEMARHLTFVREPRKMPAVLSPEEVARLLEAAPGPKYKAALSAAYAAGLRVSEVVALKVSDIDSERLLLLIEQNTDVRLIQVLLGHAKVDTTALYTQVATNVIRAVISPLDRLTLLTAKRPEPPA